MPKPKAIARVLAIQDPADISGDLNTEKQRVFVEHYSVSGIDGATAAKLAGYASPAQDAYRLLGLAHIRQAIRARRESLIHGDLAKKALSTLAELMEPGTPAPVRLGASRTALEMAGHLGIKEAPKELDNRPLGELTVNELEALIKEGSDFLANAKLVPAKVVELPS